MLLRAFAVCIVATALFSADARTDAIEAVAPLAAALSDGDAGAFIRRIPPTAPNYSELRANVQGLVDAAAVTSSVEIRDAAGTSAELDWYMEIRSRATGTIVERRRAIVRVTLEGGRLRSIEPASYFAPPKAAD